MNSLANKKPGTVKPMPLGSSGHVVQPKLEINQPGDRYEQEADAMAEMVMRMPEKNAAAKPVTGLIGNSVQRKCVACEEEEKKLPLMRKVENGIGGFQAPPSLASSLSASRSGGSPLSPQTRNFMETAFSTDFSRVRVHTDNRASEMSKSINAKAFTHGNDVYFNSNNYRPNSFEGNHLLAHELAHVIQQRENNPESTSPPEIQRQNTNSQQPAPDELPPPFGKFLASAFMYGPQLAAQLSKVSYVAKVTGSTSTVTVLGKGTYNYPVQVVRGDTGFYFVHNSFNDASALEIHKLEDPDVLFNPGLSGGESSPPLVGPPLSRENQPLIRIKAGATEEASLRKGRLALIWLTTSARIKQETDPPPPEKERELPLPRNYEVDEQLFKMAIQASGSVKLSLLGLTGGILNPDQFYDLPLNITYYTQDGMEAYVSRNIVGRDFFYTIPISHVANFLRFYPVEEGAKSALKNEPLYRGIFDLGISFIPIVGPLYGLAMAGKTVYDTYNNWDRLSGGERAMVGIQVLMAVVPFIKTARSIAAGTREFSAGRQALIDTGVPRADATRLMLAAHVLNSEKASLQIVTTLSDSLAQEGRLTIQQLEQLRTILQKMLQRLPTAERAAMEALYATGEAAAAEQFFGVRVTEMQLQGLSRLEQNALQYLKTMAKSETNQAFFHEVADWSARTSKVADGINKIAGIAKNGNHFRELIGQLGEELLSRIGAEEFIIADELKTFVSKAANGAEAYRRLMEGVRQGRRNIIGLREKLSFLYANKSILSPKALSVQESFPKIFLTANQLEGLSRLLPTSLESLKTASESELRQIATTAAHSIETAAGVDKMLTSLSPAFSKDWLTAVDIINRTDASLIEALGAHGIHIAEELAAVAAKENGALLARQTLLNGKLVKGVKIPGILDSLAGELKTTGAVEQLLKSIGDAEQKGALFGKWALENEAALKATRPQIAEGVALIRRLLPEQASEKLAGIYKSAPDQAFAYTVLEELVQFEKLHGQEVNLQRLVTELAAGDTKAMGSSFTLAYANRVNIGKIQVFEFLAEDGFKGRERFYDLKAGGVEYEMKNWSGFGGRAVTAAADEFQRDVVRHAATKFTGLRWVISSQARSSNTQIQGMMRNVLLNPEVQKELLSQGISYQQAYNSLEAAFGQGLIQYF